MRIALLNEIFRKMEKFSRWIWKKLPSIASSEEIDREYIEGETEDEIGQIGQMIDIPDKAQRHLKKTDQKVFKADLRSF